MTITPGAKTAPRKMTPFLSTLQGLSVGIFYFCISRSSEFSPPFAFCFFSVKYTFTNQR